VFRDAKLIRKLRAGEYHEIPNLRENTQITTDKPVLVAQYSQGYQNGDSIGDPMMMLISPTQQFLDKYRFATPINGSWEHYVNVVVPRESVLSMELNGKLLNPKIFKQFGTSRYMIAQIKVPFGTHTIQGDEPFGLYSYGFGFGDDRYDAYGNLAGQNFEILKDAPDREAPFADDVFAATRNSVIFRDDRTSDKGIRAVELVRATGIEVVIPSIVEGVPQVEIPLTPTSVNTAGTALFRITDAAGNDTLFTVCYALDPSIGEYSFLLNAGEVEKCESSTQYYYGAFINYNYSFHTPKFTQSGNIAANGEFGVESGGGGYLGLLVGKRFGGQWGWSGRLQFQSFGGAILAPDSVPSGRIDDDQFLQEGHKLELTNLYATLGVTGEWYLGRFVYGFVALRASIPLSKSIEYKRVVVSPLNYAYDASGTQERLLDEDELTSLSSFVPSTGWGLGFLVPIKGNISLFGETSVSYYLSDIINDGPWSLTTWNANLGVRIGL
jgi:hypothetical protein